MISPGTPRRKSIHIFIANEVKSVRYKESITDHISVDMYIQFNRWFPQIELKTIATIDETTIAYINAIHAGSAINGNARQWIAK